MTATGGVLEKSTQSEAQEESFEEIEGAQESCNKESLLLADQSAGQELNCKESSDSAISSSEAGISSSSSTSSESTSLVSSSTGDGDTDSVSSKSSSTREVVSSSSSNEEISPNSPKNQPNLATSKACVEPAQQLNWLHEPGYQYNEYHSTSVLVPGSSAQYSTPTNLAYSPGTTIYATGAPVLSEADSLFQSYYNFVPSFSFPFQRPPDSIYTPTPLPARAYYDFSPAYYPAPPPPPHAAPLITTAPAPIYYFQTKSYQQQVASIGAQFQQQQQQQVECQANENKHNNVDFCAETNADKKLKSKRQSRCASDAVNKEQQEEEKLRLGSESSLDTYQDQTSASDTPAEPANEGATHEATPLQTCNTNHHHHLSQQQATLSLSPSLSPSSSSSSSNSNSSYSPSLTKSFADNADTGNQNDSHPSIGYTNHHQSGCLINSGSHTPTPSATYTNSKPTHYSYFEPEIYSPTLGSATSTLLTHDSLRYFQNQQYFYNRPNLSYAPHCEPLAATSYANFFTNAAKQMPAINHHHQLLAQQQAGLFVLPPAPHQEHAYPRHLEPVVDQYNQHPHYLAARNHQTGLIRQQPTVHALHYPTYYFPPPPPPPPPPTVQLRSQAPYFNSPLLPQQQQANAPHEPLLCTGHLCQDISQRYQTHLSHQPVAFSQSKAGYNLISLLPIDAQQAKTRQAYGMDKVWLDEFEQLFSQFVSNIIWTLIEVETNPNIRDSQSIIGYKGRYLIQRGSKATSESVNEVVVEEDCDSCEAKECTESEDYGSEAGAEEEGEEEEEEEEDDEDDEEAPVAPEGEEKEPKESQLSGKSNGAESESDCDSGTVLNSTGCSSGHEPDVNQISKHPTKFRMFIDSAKVRFCCDTCGHGWTSMKGRVVFWYELFELVTESQQGPSSDPNLKGTLDENNSNQLVGYCAYKLFGQQCDVCKIDSRFERPMWYPEEVTKVLNNLYNKIGQIYFGFKMPTIDKQRRAGKPKTSHNSSLCQACRDGVCTDRK